MADEKWSFDQDYSAAELLRLVDHAIASVLAGGQETEYLGQRKTRADLPALYKIKKDLQQQVSAEAGLPTHNVARLKRNP